MARTLSSAQIKDGLRRAGFPEEVIPTMYAVTMAESGGNLVCSQFGSFPSRPPFGNTSCSGVKTFGLGTDDGCPLSSPPKLAANATGKGRPGSFFGTLMAWVRPRRN